MGMRCGGDVCAWGLMAVFVGGGRLSQVFTADEHCSEHSAKFERKQTTPTQIVVIQLIGLGRHPPSWIFKAGAHGPLLTLQDPIFYIDTKFGEDILISARYMSPKRKSTKTPPGSGIPLPVSRLMPAIFRGFSHASSCKI